MSGQKELRRTKHGSPEFCSDIGQKGSVVKRLLSII